MKFDLTNRADLERIIKSYLFERQKLVPEFLGINKPICVFGVRKEFYRFIDVHLSKITDDQIRFFLEKYQALCESWYRNSERAGE